LSRVLLLALFLFALTTAGSAQNGSPLLAVDVEAGSRPLLKLAGLLADKELQRVVESGLPLRVNVRIELWRDRVFDELKQSIRWNAVLAYEPLARQYIVRTQGDKAPDRKLNTYADARAALENGRPFPLKPSEKGRYYYTATVDIETLSLSDLEELERWLRGELGPAVTGDRSVPGAIGEGAKRLMIRVLDLPTRSVELKTGHFRMQ
jgi:Domain of unknown function (DUF4390)